jgi:uncharacterized membrane protein YgcG
MSKILAFTLMLLTASAAFAAKAQVVDNAGFFSPDAVQQANQQLADLEQKSGKQLRIETYAQIPEDMRASYSEANKQQFFHDWAAKRGNAEGIRGVIILITKDPSYLLVDAGKSMPRGSDAPIREAMLSAFKQKNYDQGLTNAINGFADAIRAPVEAPAASSGNAGAATSGPPPLLLPGTR